MKLLILSLLIALSCADLCKRMRPSYFPIRGSLQDIDPTTPNTQFTQDNRHTYGCIHKSDGARNPNWYYLKFDQDANGRVFKGKLEHESLDMDFVLFKNSFENLEEAVHTCGVPLGYDAGVGDEKKFLACSYSSSNQESFEISDFKKGEIYIFVLSTFGNSSENRIEVKFTGNLDLTANTFNLPPQHCNKRCNGCYKNSYNCRKCRTNQEGIEMKSFQIDGIRLYKSKQCNCAKGFYYFKAEKSCKKCGELCKTCKKKNNGEHCKTCKFLTNVKSAPNCQCQTQYFANNRQSKCSKCSKKCKTCMNTKSNCIQCKGVRINAPSCQCPQNFYQDDNQECVRCGTLGDCQGSKYNYISCWPEFNRELFENSCECKEGYFQKIRNGEMEPNCRKCSGMCQNCQDNKYNCTSCKSLQTRIPAASCPCKQGFSYFYNKNSADCSIIDCHQTCETCFRQQNPSSCSSCNYDRYLVDNKCKCKDGFYENNNKKCKGCKVQCYTCAAYNSCTSCQPGFELKGNSCKCPSGFFMSSCKKCFACPRGCKKCTSAESCQECTHIQRNLQDLCRPFDGWYEVDDCHVELCSPGCKICRDKFTCIECDANDNREPFEGKCVCMPGHYPVEGQGYCKPCGFKIESCECNCREGCAESIICQANRAVKIFGNGCSKCVCMGGYYQQNGECKPCHYKCSSCTTYEQCIEGCNGEFRDFARNCGCLDGYYEDYANGKCKPCKGCATCNGPDTCIGCNPELNLVLVNGKCQCMEGYYYSQTEFMCVKCSAPNCFTCSYADDIETCIGCDPELNLILVNGMCVCDYNQGYYLNTEGVCAYCENLKCERCNSEGECDPCKDANAIAPACDCNLGYIESNGYCEPCHPNCTQCEGSSDRCIGECREGKVLRDGWCYCEDGFWLNSDYKCIECQPPCETCLNASTCIECKDPNMSLRNCTNCVYGFFKNAEGICAPCESPCETCVDSATNCQECIGSYRLKEENCGCNAGYYECNQDDCCKCNTNSPYYCLTCMTESICNECFPPRVLLDDSKCGCPYGWFDYRGNCSACNYRCAACSGGEDSNCSPCKGANRDLGNSCYCNVGFFESDKQCIPCPSNCKSCRSYDQCITCKHELMNTNEQCKCKNKYYQQGLECFQCMRCCSKCSSANTCDQCKSANYRDSGNSCLPIAGYFERNQNNCVVKKCSNNCKTCSSQTNNCISCEPPLILENNRCVCPYGQYINNRNECNNCPARCPQCLNKNQCKGDCVSVTRSSDSNCQCAMHYVEPSPYRDACAPCNYKCDTCMEKPTQCIRCKSGCGRTQPPECKCRPGYVEIQKECVKCSHLCNTCEGSKDNCIDCKNPAHKIAPRCDDCDQGFYMSSYVCRECYKTCSICTSWKDCEECVSELRDPTKQQCPCRRGYYENNKDCTLCDYSCKACISADNCTDCYGNRVLTLYYPRKCPCMDGFYDEEGVNQCQPCDEKCKTCSSATICMVCYSGYYGESCLPCHGTCQTCTGPTDKDCKLCIDGMIYDHKAGDCDCPQGQRWNEQLKECVGCADCCAQCYNDQCYQAVPHYYIENKTCNPCKSSCDTCNSADKCLTCKSEWNEAPDCYSCMFMYFECNYKGASVRVCQTQDVYEGERDFDFRVKSIRGDFEEGPANVYLNYDGKDREETAKLRIDKNVSCLSQEGQSTTSSMQFIYKSKNQKKFQKLDKLGRIKNLIQVTKQNLTDSEFKGEEKLQKLELIEALELDQQ